MSVPNTENYGRDAGKSFSSALDIQGTIGLNGAGGQDYYSFTGNAGDVITST